MKIKLIIHLFMLISSPLFVGCQESISCRNDPQYVTIRNSNYEYNCGKEYVEIRDIDGLSKICAEFEHMNQAPFLLTNYNNGYIDITVNYTNNLFSPDMITLIFTVNNGYVFRMQNGIKYRNDSLAEYLIDFLKIKEVYSDKRCNE